MEGDPSLKSDCSGAAAEDARVLAKLCLKDAKLPCLEAARTPEGDGDGGRLEGDGVGGCPFFVMGEGLAIPFVLAIFFLEPNERRNDHSDSN